MKIAHLVKVRFDVRRPDIDQEWLERRFRFFFDHTLKSLGGQTFKDWRLWVNCQQGMSGRIDSLASGLQERGWAGRTLYSFGDDAPARHTLPPEIRDADWVYVTRIDSDDLFAPDAMEIVARQIPKADSQPSALLFQRGYTHELKTGRTGTYFSHSPPFHTLLIPRHIFQDEVLYHDLWSRVGDHSRVGKELPCKILPEYKFTVLIHDSNFLSTFDYGREPDRVVPKNFSVENFLDPPVVFDVDDFSDRYGGESVLDELWQLKRRYPNFKCTLFTIPNKVSEGLLQKALRLPWVELGLHGWDHEPVQELKVLTPAKLLHHYGSLNLAPYARVFRPPGWHIEKGHIDALSRLHLGMALHKEQHGDLFSRCRHGYYACGDRFPYWHGHTHDVCGNWLRKAVPDLLTKWSVDQKFAFVSDALLVRPK